MKKNEYVVANKDGCLYRPNEAIFPILKQMENDNWQMIGSAFFITKNGIFLTAKHVLLDVLEGESLQKRKQVYPICAILFPRQGICQFRPILKGFLNVKGDVAAGVISTFDSSGRYLENPFHVLNRKIAKSGDKIVTYAYPKTTYSDNNIQFRGDFYEGEVCEYYPSGRDSTMLPNPCYQTNIDILGGASGSPVFSEGTVIGINSTSYEGNSPPISFVSGINSVFDIIIENILLPCGYCKSCTIEELHQMGYVSVVS